MDTIINFDYEINSETFEINFKPITRKLLSFDDEIRETCKKIRKLTDKPLYLCLSGGIDSESIARSFLECKIDFIVTIFRFAQDINKHDIDYAFKFCEKYNIKPLVIDMDLNDFVISKMPNYTNQGYGTYKIFRNLILFMMDTINNLGGTAVIGGGPAVFSTKNNTVGITYNIDTLFALEWLKENKQFHIPLFYLQNPEIFASYLMEDIIQVMTDDYRYFINYNLFKDLSLEKMMVMHKYWPEMERRSKYHGFELINKSHGLGKIIFSRNIEVLSRDFPVSIIKQQLGI